MFDDILNDLLDDPNFLPLAGVLAVIVLARLFSESRRY
jgi:hypothetical protein